MSSSSRNTVIESLGVYLPPDILPTHDVIAGCDNISVLKRILARRIEKLTGIKERRLASDTESASGMAGKAIANCLAASACQASDIDLLICCGISRYGGPNQYVHEPALAVGLAGHFGFRNALALDISNGCAGMFTAITIADSLIAAGLIRTALIVSGEHITDLLKNAQKEVTGYADTRFACLTLGDAAAAIVLKEASGNGAAGFHALELYTASQYSEYCIGKPTAGHHGGPIMYTESAKLFDVAENYVIPDTARVLDSLHWGRDELDHIISHQTAQTAIDTLYEVNRLTQREILHAGNVVNNLASRGNTASTSHFIALWDHIQNGSIEAGDRVLFAVQGSGMTIGTAAYTLDDLPDRVRTAAGNGHGKTAASAPGRARAILRGDAPRIRIESLGVSCSGASGIAMAQRAMLDCLSRSAYQKEDIEVLIFAGVHRDEFIAEPAIAALIAGRLKMNDSGGLRVSPKKTLAFDVCNGSMGFLNACYIGAGMIRAGRAKSVMIVASEIEPNALHPDWEQLGVATAGSAVVLDSSGGRTGFGHGVFDSFPDQIDAYASWLASSFIDEKASPRLHVTRQPDLEDLYLKRIPDSVQQVLKCEGLRMEDIKVILPPQIPGCFVARLADALRVDSSRVVDLTASGRDLSSSSLAHSFANIAGTTVSAGDVGLIVSVGSGLQVAAATYHF